MPASVLRHRGIEAWLEDAKGHPIAFSEDVEIDTNDISTVTWVNVKPRQVSLCFASRVENHL